MTKNVTFEQFLKARGTHRRRGVGDGHEQRFGMNAPGGMTCPGSIKGSGLHRAPSG